MVWYLTSQDGILRDIFTQKTNFLGDSQCQSNTSNIYALVLAQRLYLSKSRNVLR